MSRRPPLYSDKLRDEVSTDGLCRTDVYVEFNPFAGPEYDPCERPAVRDGVCAHHLPLLEEEEAENDRRARADLYPAEPTTAVEDPWSTPALGPVPW